MTRPEVESAEAFANRLLPCQCHEGFKSRKLSDPSCPRHNFAEDVADAITARDAAIRETRALDWTLAMGAALGMASGYSVPLVPEVEPFRALFAAIRAAALIEASDWLAVHTSGDYSDAIRALATKGPSK